MNPSTAQFFMPSGLYGITPDWEDTDRLVAAVLQAIEGGMCSLQLRRKKTSISAIEEQAKVLRTICHKHQVAFFINDHADLAVRLGVGTHLGAEDGDIHSIRAQYPNLPIGISGYNHLDAIKQAQSIQACYVALGAVFPSSTKPQAVHAPLDLLTQAKKHILEYNTSNQSQMKLVAIGGITPENADSVWKAGADCVAVIHHLFETEDVTKNAKKILQNVTF